MLILPEKTKDSFNNENIGKYFLIIIKFPNEYKFYSHNNIIIYNPIKDTWYNFLGSLTSEIQFSTGFKSKDNSVRIPSINISIVDNIDLFDMTKLYEINFSEISLYLSTEDLNLNEALPLFKGVIGINEIDLVGNPFSVSFTNIDYKYDKIFPPLVLEKTNPIFYLYNDAEKYIGEYIPIIFGKIEYPGCPIPMIYDSTTIRQYAICNHYPITSVSIYSDGILVPVIAYSLGQTWSEKYGYISLISIVNNSYYISYFKNKKITATCDGLLYNSPNNPSIGDIILYMLQNYSNLSSDLIDLQGIYINKAYLSSFKVSRFFNSSSTIFDTIKELTSEFPFFINTRGFTKSIVCTDPLNIPYTFVMQKYKHYLERVKGIAITKHTELYNKFSVRYKYDALNNRWLGYDYLDSSNNNDCLVLQVKLGGLIKEKEPLDLYSVSDATTARNILNYLTKIYCFNRYSITYKCKHNTIFLEIGDGILLIDEELNFNREKFVVVDKTIGRDFIYFTLENTERIGI